MSSFSSPRKRPRTNTVLEKAVSFFEITSENEDKKMYKCTICLSQVNGTKAHNFASHLRTKHPTIFKEINPAAKDSLHVKRLKLDSWCNQQKMIDYYAEMNKNHMFPLLKKKWNVLKDVLNIPYKASVQLKNVSLTLSDVHVWIFFFVLSNIY